MKNGLRLLFTKQQIDDAIDRIVEKLCDDKELGKDFVVLCVLKGAFIFCADLVRQLPMIPQIDFIRVQSYENDRSTGTIKWLLKPSVELAGKNVLIVEDIVDTGSTIYFLRKELKKKYEVQNVKIATLLWKSNATVKGVTPEYYGLQCPNKYVIGYGLDSKDRMRHLPQIDYMEK